MKGFALLAVPLAGALLLLAAFVFRQESPIIPRRSSWLSPLSPFPSPDSSLQASLPRVPRAKRPAAVPLAPVAPDPMTIAEAAERARIASLYQNYRAAVATENEQLRSSLLPIILKDRRAALEFAQADLDDSVSSDEQRIAASIAAELRN